MSKYLSRMLLVDERILYATELHWVLYLRGFMFILIGSLIGYFGPHLTNEAMREYLGLQPLGGLSIGAIKLEPLKIIALLVIAYGAIELLVAFVKQISTELVITNRRVIAKYGFIACNSFELLLTKVEGANVDQTIFGRLMGFGTILVKGTGGGISPVDHIDRPFRFHSALMNTLQRLRQSRAESAALDD